MARKKRVKRGYPVALLLGLNRKKTTIWKMFSKNVKLEKVFNFSELNKSKKSNYNAFEIIINAFRPTIKEGVKSIIIVTIPRSSSANDFISHIKRHHSWLNQGQNKISISQITGLINTKEEVKIFIKNNKIQKLISKTTDKETDELIRIVDKSIASNNSKKEILYSFEEIQKTILINKKKKIVKLKYLLLTDKYLETFKNKNQINRVLQIGKNMKIKIRIISSESSAGLRLTQLGGLVCIKKI